MRITTLSDHSLTARFIPRFEEFYNKRRLVSRCKRNSFIKHVRDVVCSFAEDDFINVISHSEFKLISEHSAIKHTLSWRARK